MPFTRRKVEFALFLCDRVLFSLNKEFFRYVKKLHIPKKLHFWVKIVILEIPIFRRILWSGIVGAIDTFVAKHVDYVELIRAETSSFAHKIILKLEGRI